RHHQRDRRGVLLLRLGGVGQLLVLPLVRSRHRRPRLEPRAAQSPQGVQVPSTLPVGLRRRRDVPDALLPLVRAPAEMALPGVSEHLPPLQQGRERLDGRLPMVRQRRHRARLDPPSATPRAAALGRRPPQGLEVPRAAAAGRLGRIITRTASPTRSGSSTSPAPPPPRCRTTSLRTPRRIRKRTSLRRTGSMCRGVSGYPSCSPSSAANARACRCSRSSWCCT